MQRVFVKFLRRMEDGAAQYAALVDYINKEYDTDRDPIVEVVDARWC